MFKLFFVFLLFISSTYASELKIIFPDQTAPTVNARIFSKYLSKYLNQKIIITEIPGASSMTAMQYLYEFAPKDGNTIGIFYKNAPLIARINYPSINLEKINWLGSTMDGRKDAVILFSWKNIDDELIVGTDNSIVGDPIDFIINNTNIRIKKITGYRTPSDIRLAFQRKEIDSFINSVAGIKTFSPEWLNDNSGVKKLLQFGNGPNRNVEFPDVPTLYEYLSDDNKQLLSIFESQYVLLRPYVAPPNIPENRIKELREAFWLAANDPEYIKEARDKNIDVDPIDYREAESIINKLVNTPKELLDQLR